MEGVGNHTEKSGIRKRKRQFFALLIGVLIGMLPTVNVLAKTIVFDRDGHTDAKKAYASDSIKWDIASSGYIQVNYSTPDGVEPDGPSFIHEPCYNHEFDLKDCSIANLDYWKITNSSIIEGNTLVVELECILKSGEDDEDDEDEEEPVIKHNPDAINAHYYLNGMLNDNYLLGKTEQSPLGQIAFNAARPKSWSKAFSMSMSYQGRNEYSKKDGTIVLYVPEAYHKKGRKYAIMAIDKSGNVTILEDRDIFPYLVTVTPRLEGYAYELIYSDQ